MRLRHGYFRVQRECDGETTYEAHPNGDGLFEWEEREKYIRKGLKSLGFHKSFEDKSINNPDIPESIIDHYADTALPDNNKAHLDWVIKQHRLGNITPDTAASIRPHVESYIRNKNSLGKLKDYDVASLKNATNDLLDKNQTKNEIIDKDTKTIFT